MHVPACDEPITSDAPVGDPVVRGAARAVIADGDLLMLTTVKSQPVLTHRGRSDLDMFLVNVCPCARPRAREVRV